MLVRSPFFWLMWSLVVPSQATQEGASLSAPASTTTQAVQSPVDGTLAGLVAELERNNPELQAAKRQIDMRVARVAPAGAYPDPILSASSMAGFGRPPFFPSATTPNAFRQVGISQEVPHPAKRALRTSIAASEVEAERWNYEDRRLMLTADLKATYLDYALARHSLELLGENKTLLEQLRQVAESRFSVGKGVQQDVIKAQLEVSTLIERQTLLAQQRDAFAARLNALLFRSQGAPPPPAPTYVTAAPPTDLASLHALVDGHLAALQRDAKLIDKNRQLLALARKDLLPDFQFGLTAQRYVGDMPWMYGVDVMVSLPIYAARKQRPLIAEAAAALESSERDRDNERARATAEVTQAFLAMRAADQLVMLYGDSVLPQSRLALESSIASYQVGAVDFLSVLTNFEAVLAAQISRLEQQTRRDQALVRLEPFVGLEFVK